MIVDDLIALQDIVIGRLISAGAEPEQAVRYAQEAVDAFLTSDAARPAVRAFYASLSKDPDDPKPIDRGAEM